MKISWCYPFKVSTGVTGFSDDRMGWGTLLKTTVSTGAKVKKWALCVKLRPIRAKCGGMGRGGVRVDGEGYGWMRGYVNITDYTNPPFELYLVSR